MALLIIRLHRPKSGTGPLETLDWALLGDDRECQEFRCSVSLEDIQLPTGAAGAKLMLVVPSEDVVQAQIQVPSKQRRHLQKALPYLVEEVIADPIENMHLVLDGAIKPDGTAQVLAVAYDCMELWVQSLTRLELEADQLCSELSLLDNVADELLLCMNEDFVLLKSDGAALKSSTRNLNSMLAMLEANQDKPFSKARILTTLSFQENQSAQIAALQTEFEGEGLQVEIVQRESIFQHLCEAAGKLSSAKKPITSLLQAPYEPARGGQKTVSWKLLGYAACICIALQILFNLGLGVYFNSRGETVKQEVIERYRELFPQDRKIVDIKVQMQNHLKRGSQSKGDVGFLHMMGVVGYQIQSMRQSQNMQIKQVRYDDLQGTMMLDMDVRQVQQLDQFKRALASQGLAVTILSASDESQWVKGRLRISRGA